MTNLGSQGGLAASGDRGKRCIVDACVVIEKIEWNAFSCFVIAERD